MEERYKIEWEEKHEAKEMIDNEMSNSTRIPQQRCH